MGKTEGKVPFARHKRRWENIIKMDFQEVGCRGTNCNEMTQKRKSWRAIANSEMNLKAEQNVGKLLTKLEPASFSSRTE